MCAMTCTWWQGCRIGTTTELDTNLHGLLAKAYRSLSSDELDQDRALSRGLGLSGGPGTGRMKSVKTERRRGNKIMRLFGFYLP